MENKTMQYYQQVLLQLLVIIKHKGIAAVAPFELAFLFVSLHRSHQSFFRFLVWLYN
jgi:hypothetical protein